RLSKYFLMAVRSFLDHSDHTTGLVIVQFIEQFIRRIITTRLIVFTSIVKGLLLEFCYGKNHLFEQLSFLQQSIEIVQKLLVLDFLDFLNDFVFDSIHNKPRSSNIFQFDQLIKGNKLSEMSQIAHFT